MTGREIQLTTKEVLTELVRENQEKLPFSLKVKHIVELTNTSDTTIYEALTAGKIPGAKKIMGVWRVPRDIFLTWWYGVNREEDGH